MAKVTKKDLIRAVDILNAASNRDYEIDWQYGKPRLVEKETQSPLHGRCTINECYGLMSAIMTYREQESKLNQP